MHLRLYGLLLRLLQGKDQRMSRALVLTLGVLALLPSVGWAQEQEKSGQSVKDKLRSTLPP
nr:hypothetical protein [Armatimonas sp.]